jgi:hypothetical protein
MPLNGSPAGYGLYLIGRVIERDDGEPYFVIAFWPERRTLSGGNGEILPFGPFGYLTTGRLGLCRSGAL